MTISNRQPPNLATEEWLKSPALKLVFSLLGGGEEARVVGGAVRDSLLGQTIGDIDLACIHSSDEISRRAEAAGVKAIPTGGQHGTISLVVTEAGKAHVFEVTPLRIDLETDGRRAVVAPTQNWALDAHRRDFTINALYCDEAGKIYDFVDGCNDILARRVRFIGSAERRINEDYLRILRFFRFSALHSDGALEPVGLTACIALKEGLATLSSERIKQELFKLLVAPFAKSVIARMVDSGIMESTVTGHVNLDYFANFIDIEREVDLLPNALLRLAAISGGQGEQLGQWAKTLKLSNKEKGCLSDISGHVHDFSYHMEEKVQKVLLYRLGRETYENCVLVAWCLVGLSEETEDWKKLYFLPRRWQPPVFSISGGDILELGVQPGPQVGKLLMQLEEDWINAGFTWSAQELKSRLKSAVS